MKEREQRIWDAVYAQAFATYSVTGTIDEFLNNVARCAHLAHSAANHAIKELRRIEGR